MATRCTFLFVWPLVLILSSGFTAIACGQESRELDSPNREPSNQDLPSLVTGVESAPSDLRTELEPGVVIYGKPHRFAEVGNCQSFDSSPDGRTLVFASNKLKFFDLIDNQVIEEVGEDNENYNLTMYSPDGRYVFAYSYANQKPLIRVYDAIDGSLMNTIPATSGDEENPNARMYAQTMVVSADAKFIALQGSNEIQVRNVDTGQVVLNLKDLGYVQSLAFTPDERELFFSSGSKLQVHDLASGEIKSKSDSVLVDRRGNFVTTNLSRELVAVSQSNSVEIFDIKQNKRIGNIQMPPQAYAQQMAFSDDGSMLAISVWEQASGGGKMALHIADVDKKQVIKKLSIASQGITKCVFSADRMSLFVTGHGIFGVQEVRLDADDEVADAGYPAGPAQFGVIHPGGQSFMTCSSAGEVTWFDTATGKVQRSYEQANTASMLLTKDGSEVIISKRWGNELPIVRLNYESGKSVKTYSIAAAKKSGVFDQIRSFVLEGGPNLSIHNQIMPLSVKLSPDESTLNVVNMEMVYRTVVGGFGGGVEQEQEFLVSYLKLDADSGKRLASSSFKTKRFGFGDHEWVQIAAAHPVESQFALARASHVFVVDPASGDTIDEIDVGNNNQVRKLDYSPSGKFLYASTHQGIWVWDADNRTEVMHVESKFGTPNVAFSKDDSRMVCCYSSRNSEIVVYKTSSWTEEISRKKTEFDRRCVVMSDDGQKLLIGLGDCRMELWDLAVMQK